MPSSCLAAGDPAPFVLHRSDAGAPVLLTCDHASNRVPASLAGLGLKPGEIDRHIGWDIGAAAVTRALGERLGVASVLAGFSRLVIDCNRAPDDPTSIPAASDGVAVPANIGLGAAERADRHAAIFAPYHQAISAWIETRLAGGTVPALISVHSFTPVMAGVARPWHVGILWDADPRIPVPLLEALDADPALVVGDNQPYSARDPVGYTVYHHAVARGLPHVAIELRQDLVADDEGAARWAALLGQALAPILTRREIYRVFAP